MIKRPSYIVKVVVLSLVLLPLAAVCIAAPEFLDPEPVMEACAGAVQPERNGWLQAGFFTLALAIALMWARLVDRTIKLESANHG